MNKIKQLDRFLLRESFSYYDTMAILCLSTLTTPGLLLALPLLYLSWRNR